MREIQLRDAKAELSALVENAAQGETAVITHHGKPRAVLVGVDEWNRLVHVLPLDVSPSRDAALSISEGSPEENQVEAESKLLRALGDALHDLSYALLAYVVIRNNMGSTADFLAESRECAQRGANAFVHALCAVDEPTADALSFYTHDVVDRLGDILGAAFENATERAAVTEVETERGYIVDKVCDMLFTTIIADIDSRVEVSTYYSTKLDPARTSDPLIKAYIRDMFVPFFDKLQILGRMTRASISLAMQPYYKAYDHRPIIEMAKHLGILVEYRRAIYSERGRRLEIVWVEPGDEYRYELDNLR